MAVQTRPERCPQNHRCPAVRVCPTGAITQERYDAPKVDAAKCIDCGKCQIFCAFRVFN